MNRASLPTANRRQFLSGVGGIVGAGTVHGAAGAASLDALSVAGSATVVLHDPRIVLPPQLAERLAANGARIIALDGDPVRMWRTEVGTLLRQPSTRLLGLTLWADYLMVRGLAAETRRHTRYEQHDAERGHFTWLIA